MSYTRDSNHHREGFEWISHALYDNSRVMGHDLYFDPLLSLHRPIEIQFLDYWTV